MSDKCFECESELTKTCLSCNTRAVPDVPELVAVSHEVFYAPTREWRKTVEPEYYRKNGDLVRDLIDKRKAAEIIAAKDGRIVKLEDDNKRLREALKVTEAAISEFYRYQYGGEMRGSYDGKPERDGLWKAMHLLRAALGEVKP